MPAEIEKVIVAPDFVNVERFLPQPHNLEFEIIIKDRRRCAMMVTRKITKKAKC